MKIISTTDGKYVGVEVELTPAPLKITDDFLFYYEKKIIDGDQIILANSNYVITIK